MSESIVPAAQVSSPLAGVSLDVLAVVPRDDRALYATLSQAAKDDLRNWVGWLLPVIKLGKKPKGLTGRLAAVSRNYGTSSATTRRKWDAYWTYGWKGLVNRALAGPEWQERKEGVVLGIAHRKEFLAFLRMTFESNQRGSRAAYKFTLLPRLKKWRATGDAKFAIPGYDSPPPNAEGHDHPHGWSYDNLMEHSSTRFELAAARIGLQAAYDERPLVYTTRVGLWVGSHYQIDDMWHNFFVNTFAERKHGRPLELFTHDLFAARKLRWGVRVRVKGEDGKYKGLEERMTRLVVAATLYLDGYSPRGTVLIAEHGTAAISTALETALCELSGGLITVARSGMQGAKAHGGQYPGIARGNPRMKASLESSNNLTQNVFGSLPGQTGKDVVSRPEELGALLSYNATLLAAYDKLSPERRSLLEFDLLELGQFHGVAHELYGLIENDPDHNLEGWAECGHFVQQIWADGEWRDLPDLTTLDPAVSERLVAALEAGTIRSRPRKMSRREVWDRGAGELIKLPGHGVWEILREDLAVERQITGNELVFEDEEVGPGKHRYRTRGVDAFGHPVELSDRTAYRVIVNPFAPDMAFVGDMQGRYIGEFRATARPTRGTEADDPDILAAMGEVAQREGELLAPLRERHAGKAAAKDARHKRNAALMDTARPATKEERDEIKRQREVAFDSDDFTTHPVLEQVAPSVASEEGDWLAPEQPDTQVQGAETETYSASDFF